MSDRPLFPERGVSKRRFTPVEAAAENAWWATRPLDDAPTAAQWNDYVRSLVAAPQRRPVSRYHEAFRLLRGLTPYACVSWRAVGGAVTVEYRGDMWGERMWTSR